MKTHNKAEQARKALHDKATATLTSVASNPAIAYFLADGVITAVPEKGLVHKVCGILNAPPETAGQARDVLNVLSQSIANHGMVTRAKSNNKGTGCAVSLADSPVASVIRTFADSICANIADEIKRGKHKGGIPDIMRNLSQATRPMRASVARRVAFFMGESFAREYGNTPAHMREGLFQDWCNNPPVKQGKAKVSDMHADNELVAA